MFNYHTFCLKRPSCEQKCEDLQKTLQSSALGLDPKLFWGFCFMPGLKVLPIAFPMWLQGRTTKHSFSAEWYNYKILTSQSQRDSTVFCELIKLNNIDCEWTTDLLHLGQDFFASKLPRSKTRNWHHGHILFCLTGWYYVSQPKNIVSRNIIAQGS